MLAFSLVLLTVEHVSVLHSLCLMCFSLCYGWLSPSGVLFLLPQPIFISVASSRHQCVVSRLLRGFMPCRGCITLISWTLLDILDNDWLGPVWQSLTCCCCQRFAGPCLAIVDLNCCCCRRRRRRRRRSRFRPCLPLLSGFSNLFHGFPFVVPYWFHLFDTFSWPLFCSCLDGLLSSCPLPSCGICVSAPDSSPLRLFWPML